LLKRIFLLFATPLTISHRNNSMKKKSIRLCLFELNHTINREKGMMTNIFVCTVIYSSIIKYIFMQNLQIASSKQSTNRDGEREIIAFKSRSKAEKNVLSKTKKFTCLLRAILWSRFSLSMSLKKYLFISYGM